MKKIQPKKYKKSRNLICDWIDKKNYLVHFRMLKIYVRHGMAFEKIQKIISFKQSKLLEQFIRFNTQKGNKAKNDFQKGFNKLLNNAFYGKTMENARNRLRLEFFKKDEYKLNIKQQSKLTFHGIQKLYENCDSYLFKKMKFLWISQFT